MANTTPTYTTLPVILRLIVKRRALSPAILTVLLVWFDRGVTQLRI